MKKLFTLCIALFSMTYIYAQEDILLDDFESGVVSFTDEVKGNPPAHFDYAVVDNPYKTGINTSNKVWEWKRFDAETENKIWAGFYATLKNEIPSGYHRIEVKYLRKNTTSQLKIKCEDGPLKFEIAANTPASKTNEWETMVFDLTKAGVKKIKVFGMFPDFYEPIDPTAITYIDDIQVIYDPEVIIPTPTTLILFDNSASDRFHDQSWVNQTPPSTVVTEHWDPLSTDPGDKLPVVTSPVKAGTNALKLQWKSVETGDWKAMTASIGWKAFDLTTMKELRFWVNSPVALSGTALPMVYLEAHSGTPNITGKLPLANYLTNGLTAETWTEVIIPLDDLWAADPAFVAKDVVKDVFFSQNATDNVEHTLYLDEFKFESGTTGLDNPIAGKVLKTYYANGEIIISNYSGFVRVFDLIGRNVAEGLTTNGILKVNLNKGIYIVNTTKGNAKIVLN